MQSALRPYATAGVAIVGASLIAVTPVAASPPPIGMSRDLALTAGVTLPDLLAPWVGPINTASANLSQLANNYFLAPGVGMQQALSNITAFLQQVLHDPSSIPDVTDQLRENLKAVASGFTLLGVDQDTFDTVVKHTLDSGLISHLTIFQSLPGLLPPGLDVGLVRPLVDFTASPLSGLLIGALGPALSPGIAFGNTLTAAFDALQAGDTGAALADLQALPASMLDGFLNGATLDLDPLLPLINGIGLLPAPTSLGHLDIAFGGLLTPGLVAAGPWNLYDETGTAVAEVPAVGGSMLNSIGLQLDGVPGVGTVPIHSHAVGPLAAWEGLSQLIGVQLGNNWDGKNAPAIPPGVEITFPTIPDDFGAADPAAATDLFVDLWQELAAALGW